MFLEELSFGTILDCSALIRPSSSHSQAGADLCSKDTCLVWSLLPGGMMFSFSVYVTSH
jgi:hypothetical protein